MRHRPMTATVAAAAVLALTGCGSEEAPVAQSTPIMPSEAADTPAVATTPASTPGVYTPMETGVSQSGLEASILSVEDVNSRYGPVSVFTFQVVNGTGAVWEGFNWMTPTVVYGAAGAPAEHVTSLSEGYGDGVVGAIPPGSRQTVKHAYKVTKDRLNPAVVTAGSVIWQGDFATFQR
ncbi:hypothetical protein [Nocardia carnea]|uniref:hypothetical protein n=1 Tax=Nocardia carnea TaxID=37328 RepID=UPI002453A440|nr:hypothetical protein [Nocardia carnea]